MVNTINVHQMLAREAAPMLQERCPLLMSMNRSREDEFGEKPGGYNKGDTVSITIPPIAKGFNGAVLAEGGAVPDINEGKVPLTLDTQKHVTFRLTAIEKLLKSSDERQRFLKPYVETLAQIVNADITAKATAATPNLVGTPGTPVTSMTPFADAYGLLGENLAPEGDRTAIISFATNKGLVDSGKTFQHPSTEIQRQYLRGNIGIAQGFEFFTSASLATVTNGNKVTGVSVSGAGQTGNSLVVGGLTAGDTFKKGQVFVINNVLGAHPYTGAAYTWSRQFVITADVTATGATATLPIYPAISLAANPQAGGITVNAGPANAAVITFVGAANASYRQSLAFHEDAYTMAVAPLSVRTGCEGYTYKSKGLSLRVMTGGDFTNDHETTRIDILYGFTGVRATSAVRIAE